MKKSRVKLLLVCMPGRTMFFQSMCVPRQRNAYISCTLWKRSSIRYLVAEFLQGNISVSSCLNRYLLAPLICCALLIVVIFFYHGPCFSIPESGLCCCGSFTLE